MNARATSTPAETTSVLSIANAAIRRIALVRAAALCTLGACLGCGPGALLEDPQLGETEPVVEYVNPSGAAGRSITSYRPCGTVLASFRGVAAHSNGPSTATGYSCAGTGSYGLQYQCVELVMRYFKKNWGLRWHGNAKDLLRRAPRDKVAVYMNGDAAHPPVPGDMIVWEQSTYGHVALVTAVRSNAIDIIEQNVRGSGKATLSYQSGRIGTRWGHWVASGWAHAKANTTGGSSKPSKPSSPPASSPSAPKASCHTGNVYGLTWCSASCPCAKGQGDCDSDSECQKGLICMRDVGQLFKAPSYIDVCLDPPASSPSKSTPSKSTPPKSTPPKSTPPKSTPPKTSPPVVDKTPPSLNIVSPREGQRVTQPVIVVQATDDVAVAKVELYVDGKLTETRKETPYSFSPKLVAGLRQLSVRVFDRAGKVSTARVRVVASTSAPAKAASPAARQAPPDPYSSPYDGKTIAGACAVSGGHLGAGFPGGTLLALSLLVLVRRRRRRRLHS